MTGKCFVKKKCTGSTFPLSSAEQVYCICKRIVGLLTQLSLKVTSKALTVGGRLKEEFHRGLSSFSPCIFYQMNPHPPLLFSVNVDTPEVEIITGTFLIWNITNLNYKNVPNHIYINRHNIYVCNNTIYNYYY